MKKLLHELAIPFQGGKEALQLLLAGSQVILLFLLRCLAKGIKLGWTAAMHFDAAPSKQSGPAENSAPSKRKDSGSADSQGSPGGRRTRKTGGAPTEGGWESFLVALLVVFIALGIAATGIALLWYFTAPYVSRYAQWIAVTSIVIWTIAAWTVAPPVSTSEPQDDQETSSGDQHHESPQEQFDLELASFIVSAVIDADQQGHKGVHLTELLQRLEAEKQGYESWDTTRLRAWCTTANIPFDRGVRAKGKGPTWGVRADQLEQALQVPLREALGAVPHHLAEARSAGGIAAPEPGPLPTLAEPLSPAGHGTPLTHHLEPASDPSPEPAA